MGPALLFVHLPVAGDRMKREAAPARSRSPSRAAGMGFFLSRPRRSR